MAGDGDGWDWRRRRRALSNRRIISCSSLRLDFSGSALAHAPKWQFIKKKVTSERRALLGPPEAVHPIRFGTPLCNIPTAFLRRSHISLSLLLFRVSSPRRAAFSLSVLSRPLSPPRWLDFVEMHANCTASYLHQQNVRRAKTIPARACLRFAVYPPLPSILPNLVTAYIVLSRILPPWENMHPSALMVGMQSALRPGDREHASSKENSILPLQFRNLCGHDYGSLYSISLLSD